jgi:glycosyltransferase involved in cell wall biosynthesis
MEASTEFEQSTRRFDRPRVLFVGHGGTPDAVTKQKWDALEVYLEIRAFVESDDPSTHRDDRTVVLAPHRREFLRGIAFYARLPAALRREFEHLRPDAIIAQSPYDAIPALFARRLAKAESVPVIVEVHGDWRTATRVYGSRWRRLLSPIGDVVAVWALRRADAIRAIGPAMSKLAEEASGKRPLAVFPTFHDAETYFDTSPAPFPIRPTALWVGTLQRSKNPRLLVEAWPIVAEAIPEARLVVVGSGPLQALVETLKDEYPSRVRMYSRLAPTELKREFDAATTLVLPSRSEGLGRVIIESFARGRPVIGTQVGGIPDLVEHGVNGLLVPSNDAGGLASAMVRLLSDGELAARLGRQARAGAEEHRWTPDRYALALLGLIQDTLARASERTGSPRA